jgi:hypothetical protein
MEQPALASFEVSLTAPERALMSRLSAPSLIQAFLDEIPYSTDPFYRCPLRVLRERRAHCFDGALFAAAALRRLGYPPRVVDLFPNERDDEHLVAVFRRHGRWGAVAASNFVGLRFREPVYRDLRELVMSYFEQYFNVNGEKTLRAYTRPVDLRPFDRFCWMTRDEGLERIARRTEEVRRYSLLEPQMIAELAPADGRSLKAGLLGARRAGLYRPR